MPTFSLNQVKLLSAGIKIETAGERIKAGDIFENDKMVVTIIAARNNIDHDYHVDHIDIDAVK